jgi:uncharacterized protein YydD (DUF2326 family)
MKLENFQQLEIGLTLYNEEYGNYRVVALNKDTEDFEIEITDNNPTNWDEILTAKDTERFKIFSGEWEIVSTDVKHILIGKFVQFDTKHNDRIYALEDYLPHVKKLYSKRDRPALKQKMIDMIIEFGDGDLEFSTRDINELVNWITDLEQENKELKSNNPRNIVYGDNPVM